MNLSDDTTYFSSLINKETFELCREKPVLFFLDGVGVTRDREKYDLSDNRYSDAMLSAAEKLCGDIPTLFFQISDEISIVIFDVQAFADQVSAHYITHDEFCGLAGQIFSSEFFEIYGRRTLFHIRVHNIKAEDCKRYISWRRSYTRQALYTYLAVRKGVWRKEYECCSHKELVSMLIRRGLYGRLMGNRRYLEGTIRTNAGNMWGLKQNTFH